MKIKLKKFNIFHSARFILLALNPKTAKELSNNFFYYLYHGIKGLFIKEDSYKYAILENNNFAGSIAIYKDKGEYELGYFILPKFRKKGIATKAIKEISKLAFKELGFRKIKAQTTSKNIASIKTLERNGFILQKKKKGDKALIFIKKK